ncbi:OmpL47-type beta-barrel domain-containing protein [Cytobacillus oceanisediminis]|uniref:OmpL47-type beta-barrel domain-containing protein n=1 Tax=Cytobacillus oceanisediminis TaxID=665099 RepID=UPI00164291EC|nr:hypothetical protein [Cytobacillus oceanisediminis]
MLKKLSIVMIFIMTFNLLSPLANVFAYDILTPTNLRANQAYPGNIILTWDKVTGASGYKIYEVSNGQQTLVKQVSYTDIETTVFNVPEGTFNYAVTAFRQTQETSLSNTVTVEVIYPEMQKPLNPKYSITNGNDYVLTWDKAAYATDYYIYRVSDGKRELAGTTKNLTYTLVNHPEGSYTYEITSYVARFGESAEGARLDFTVVHPELQSPIVSYAVQNGNDLVFSWVKVPYATNYKVYEIINGQRELLATTKLANQLISNVSQGRHVYEVTAQSDRFGESEVPFRIELDMVHPEMKSPGNFTYSFTNVNDINLRWAQAEFANSYKLYQIIDGEKKLILSTSALNTTYRNMPEGHYIYELSTVSDRFGESATVSRVEFDLVHPVMKAPENLNLTVQNGSDFVLRWDAAENATAYKIYQIKDGERVLVSTKTGNAATFYNMPEGEYIYEVTSYSDRFGESQDASRLEYFLGFPELKAPTLTGTVENRNVVILDWTKQEYVSGYRIYELVDGVRKFIGTTTSLQFKFNANPGQHLYEVTSYNSRFGESDYSNQVSLYIEPELTAPVVNNPAQTKDNVIISWDPVSNGDSYNLYEIVNGEPVFIGNTSDTTVTINNPQPGEHEYWIVPVSESGTEGDAYTSVKVVVEETDTAAPVTVSDFAEACSKEAVTLTLTAEDADSGVDKTFYSINGSEYVEGTSISLIEEGEYLVSFYSIDKAGNEEEAVTQEVHIDKTAPETVSDATGKWTNKEAVLNLTASDNLCGVEKTFYSVNGSDFIEGESVSLSEEGIHVISFYSIDKAGNEEEIKTALVKLDTTAPETEAAVNEADFTVKLNADDNLSGVGKTFYSVNGSSYFEGTDFQLKNEGLHLIRYYSVDNAGNIEEAKIKTVLVDKTAPVTISDITDGWYQDQVTVTLSATDNLSGVSKTYYSVDGSSFAEGSSFELSEQGVYEVSYYSVDNAGNVEEVKTETVSIDTQAPETKSNIEDSWYKGEVEVSLSVTDNLSGVENTFYSVDGSEYQEGTLFKLTEEGIHEVSYYSVDKAGNKEAVKTEEVMIDKTAPTVNFESSEEYKLSDSILLDYQAFDNLSGIASEEVFVNGMPFKKGDTLTFDQAGKYQIQIIVTDNAGWSTTVQKTIDVYIPVNLEVLPRVMLGNKGTFTVKASLPQGMKGSFDLLTATLNGVPALSDQKGLFQQAKQGQFKFDRPDFDWNQDYVFVEFKALVDGKLVKGSTYVKVLVK